MLKPVFAQGFFLMLEYVEIESLDAFARTNSI